MDDRFRIYIDKLREGKKQSIDEVFSPDFLEVNEKFLQFLDPVTVEGEAYVAGDSLVIHLDITTTATMPCTVCNSPVKEKIVLKGLYFTEELSNIKGAVYSFKDILREAILLETPPFAECNEGKCTKRKDVEKFLKSPQKNEGEYRPFADL